MSQSNYKFTENTREEEHVTVYYIDSNSKIPTLRTLQAKNLASSMITKTFLKNKKERNGGVTCRLKYT